MRYAIVIERCGKNYSAYVPDLPGCVATGDTLNAVKTEIASAVRFHIQGLLQDGIEVPAPTSHVEYIAA
jgi:predicted RNase H-like HicB family nuclease